MPIAWFVFTKPALRLHVVPLELNETYMYWRWHFKAFGFYSLYAHFYQLSYETKLCFCDNLYPEANGVGTHTIYLLQLGVGTRSFSFLETRCASVKALPLTIFKLSACVRPDTYNARVQLTHSRLLLFKLSKGL